ncbi:MAG: hypothetical protein HYT79_02160 [Elusimicrobia bacterium]|nr:hypothetical protein [Elusimicrobiota bacterium]
MQEKFGEVLARLRKAAGFKTAAGFYRSNGGYEIFGFTYNEYLNFETEKSLPRPRTLLMLARMLFLRSDQNALGEFTLAYISSAWGRDAFQYLLAPLLTTSGTSRQRHPLQAAMQRAVEPKRYNLSQRQAKIIKATPANHWVFEIFSNDKNSWSVPALAKLLGFASKKIQKALDALTEAGLVRRHKTGDYYSPHAGRFFIYPQSYGAEFGEQPKYAPAVKFYDEMARKKKGGTLFRRLAAFRASQAELTQYLPYLAQMVWGSEIYSTLDKKSDSGLFTVEATVKKIFDF